ncbi:hypothetical protein T10_353 [Trichinella papuae]|uniref:Uncharacterized protein n=1 Tax=Trichinella papuae TaxID=268474 RepID=A0A0V1M7B0_9BILA|nr:hypothetical protein T10_353 [Trichinella papuae]
MNVVLYYFSSHSMQFVAITGAAGTLMLSSVSFIIKRHTYATSVYPFLEPDTPMCNSHVIKKYAVLQMHTSV